MEIVFTKPSIIDLKNIYYNQIYYNSTNQYILNLVDYIEILKLMPYIGKRRQSKFYNIRQLIFRNHKIIYQIQENKIYIHAIVHNSKNMQESLNQFFIS